MITKYSIEIYNPKIKKWVLLYINNDIKIIEILYNKPYYTKHTRRITKIQEEILYQDKGKKPLINLKRK